MRFSTPNRSRRPRHVASQRRAHPRHRSRDCEPRASASSRSTGAGSRTWPAAASAAETASFRRVSRVIPDRSRGGDLALHRPSEVAVEKVFVNVNPQSTLLLGQARGAAICAAVLAGAARRRVHRVAGEAGGRRSRQGGEGTGRGHGAPLARSSRRPGGRRRRRARLRHRARAQRTGLGRARRRGPSAGAAKNGPRSLVRAPRAHSALGRPGAH